MHILSSILLSNFRVNFMGESQVALGWDGTEKAV